MNNQLAAKIRNVRVHIMEAVGVEWKTKMQAEVQRKMRSVLA
jgi:hypothetical protein